jgi:tetratricopeptide (TPR) repeat protein
MKKNDSQLKHIVIHQTPLFVLPWEYRVVSYPGFENLQILESLAFHERLISFLQELSYLYPQKVNLSMSGVTHGGFIPIRCSPFFKHIMIHMAEPSILHNVSQLQITNITQKMIAHDWIDINFDQPYHNIILSPHKINFPPSTYFMYRLRPYCIDHPIIYIYVSKFIHETFAKRFQYEIILDQPDHIVTYDNLLHLCIMVKNGGPQFEDMLQHNKKQCDRWTILDTGSTDRTVEIIHNTMDETRGHLYEEPFINFRDSRNRCLDLAGTSCAFTIMLDDTYRLRGNLRDFLEIVRGDQFADSFTLMIENDDTIYGSNRLMKSTSMLRYMYRIHEVLSVKNNKNVTIPKEYAYIKDHSYDYMEKRTLERKKSDILLLLEEITDDPDNPRSYYYLAQTYYLLKDYEKAFYYFTIRAGMEGFIQERIDALFESARIAYFRLHKPWEECLLLFEKCYMMDMSRPESVYFIGLHYYLENDYERAFPYFRRGLEIGFPLHCQYSLRPTLSFHFLPKLLTKICYKLKEYKTGEESSSLFLKHNDSRADSYDEIVSWNAIFKKLNEIPCEMVPIDTGDKPVLCFVADGGFDSWNGESIYHSGVGGAETYIIEMARHIQKSGHYQVIVFCQCSEEGIVEGVRYHSIADYVSYLHTKQRRDVCIISRFSEYIPVTYGHFDSIYFVVHDLSPSGIVIPIHPSLKKIMCLTEWHARYFINQFSILKPLVTTCYYGIDIDAFTVQENKNAHQFIYTSFANRGLLPLLQMWPTIQTIQPLATLHIYTDLNNEWVNAHYPKQINDIKELKIKYSSYNTICWHGWVNKSTLYNAWKKSDIWFYPCVFMETFCLSALEAAISKTFVITNGLAALEHTVGGRGLVLPVAAIDDVYSNEWKDRVIREITPYLLGEKTVEKNDYIERNYQWAMQQTWSTRARECVEMMSK